MPRKRSDIARVSRAAKHRRLRMMNETAEQRELRLSKNRDRHTLRRNNETPDERERRLRYVRERMKQRRSMAKRRSTKNPTFMPKTIQIKCEPADSDMSDYSSTASKYDPDDPFDTMAIACEKCSGLFWKGESKGMCCSPGLVKLEEPDPLQTLKISPCEAEDKTFF